MDEKGVFSQINALVAEERELRARRAGGQIEPEAELERLRQVEVSLDQCWDLLRRRDALRRVGRDPDEARPAPINQVEGYVQ
ncbi:DUF2630 family protein [Frankia sp. CNm7]|uniref:DUF2630 family protein n=1 Tax=Frankia nepalensis TaxID=1836974 RepID=A0A937RJC2_9ACTN|nr:DUF2630 family protein [Frankia nepalensis]MBL7501741.1 DUF2630 family protein [Frankia nepalensis]MBL7514359.1 DUF2630 family protein [Frankia nepalensis]MBL7523352.1 DUF2630 family protein [Frankia nepalensis]MBL7631385.1 DUF2630 family protein [Frankia nepalensis]